MSDTALGRAQMTVKVIAQTAVDNETYFCELDAVVGDGDFGYSLARGFEIVLSDFDELEYDDAGGLLKKTALVLTKRIGGTSGPIWGTAFLRAGASLAGNPNPSGADVVAFAIAGRPATDQQEHEGKPHGGHSIKGRATRGSSSVRGPSGGCCDCRRRRRFRLATCTRLLDLDR